MKRRDFIRFGSASVLSLAVGVKFGMKPRKVMGRTVDVNLTIVGADFELVDGNTVYMWAYGDMTNGGPRVPGPILEAWEGDILRIAITNNSESEHGFAIHGTPPPIVDIGIVDPGETKIIEFEAPQAGTYMYLDPINAPVNRCMGLHGALIVLPADPDEITPYSNPTPAVKKLFSDLGDASKGFPGKGWDEKRIYPYGRTWVWIFNEIEPRWNELAEQNKYIDPKRFVDEFLPRYFTLNGESGWFIAHNLNTSPRAREGEPALIRSMMAGMGTRPPHIHGNHVYVLSKMNERGEIEVQENVIELDTWTVKPLDCIDVLLPFRRPPDVPQGLWPPKEEGFPLTYPMHPHDEIAVTAGGGMYPQGIMNDWHILEPTTADPGNDGSFSREEHIVSFSQFGCKPLRISPETPDKTTPDVFIRRQFFGDREIEMPDGNKVRFWGFEDPDDPSTKGSIPAPIVRVREGQVVHCELKVKKNTHTIHWHGIEPTCFNDGVPHNSFEVNSRYTYQWQAAQAGTFFYHCHKNTVLHFQMGMSGLLVVDPPEGPGRLCTGGPKYDVEALWAIADVDPRFRELPGGHDAGMCGEDVGFDKFDPKYFMINGVPHPLTREDNKVVIKANPDQSILFRLLNSTFSVLYIKFPFDVLFVERDGRPLYPSPSNHGYSHPFIIPAGQPIEMETAQRASVWVENLPEGTYKVVVEFRHLIRPNQILGVAETKVIVGERAKEEKDKPRADVILVTVASFKSKKKEWKIEGKTSFPGPDNQVTIHVGETLKGPVLGTVNVKKSGKWKLKLKNSYIVPDKSRAISLESSKGGKSLGVGLEIDGVTRENAEDVITVTKAEFRKSKNEWRIDGTATRADNNTITIYLGTKIGGHILATVNVDKSGAWSFRLRNSNILPDKSNSISLQSSHGAQLLAVPITQR